MVGSGVSSISSADQRESSVAESSIIQFIGASEAEFIDLGNGHFSNQTSPAFCARCCRLQCGSICCECDSRAIVFVVVEER